MPAPHESIAESYTAAKLATAAPRCSTDRRPFAHLRGELWSPSARCSKVATKRTVSEATWVPWGASSQRGDCGMTVSHKAVHTSGLRFSVERDGREVAHAYLYLLSNDLEGVPFGLMDDVLVDESLRGAGIGTELVDTIIATAKAQRCYKLIAISRDGRPEIDDLYRRRGFIERGTEYRIDF